MNRLMKKYNACILMIAALLLSVCVHAGEQHVKSVVWKKGNISSSAPILSVENPETIDVNGIDNEIVNSLQVSLVYGREDRSDVASAMDWEFQVNYEVNDGSSAPITGSLIIQHEAGGEDIYEAVEYYAIASKSATLEITSVNPASGAAYQKIPNDIRLEMTLESKVFHKLSNANAYNLNLNRNILTWDYIYGAEEYELEWQYYDAESPGTSFTSFDRATRITLSDNYYPIDANFLTYPEGIISFRVRAVGRYLTSEGGDLTQLKKADWSSEISLTLTTTTLERDKNWTTITNYAEDGKYKKVVNYYDGTSRERQMITNLSTEQLSLVSEMWYDYEGREAINVLPVPDGNNDLDYRTNFNLLTSGDGTGDKDGYDLKTGYLGMDVASGASRYYSASNPLQSIHKDYIPDAEGYPYTQKIYKNDNSGRLEKQSGIGATFRLGNGKETGFYYADPSSTQLRRLFGENVGISAHYKRNVTIDPNGQVSVSYIDQYDKVVATSLDGGVPPNMEQLSTFGGGIDVINLNDNNTVSIEDRKSVSISAVFNPSDLTYTFSYDLTGGIFQQITPCATCEYDLTITITDPDGEKVILNYDGNTVDQIEALIDNNGIACTNGGSAIYSMLSPVGFTALFDKVGTYTVTKEVKLNEDAMAAILAMNVTTVDGTTLHDIEEGYTTDIDETACDFTCEQSCERLAREAGHTEGTSAWDNFVLKCVQDVCDPLRNTALSAYNQQECDVLLENMLLQVVPDGKYFMQGPSSIFWQEVEANITIEIGGTTYPTSSVSIRSILHGSDAQGVKYAYWQDSYGLQLVQYHPEFCHYQQCTWTETSRLYDKEMALIPGWNEAVAAGYTDPLQQYTSGNTFNIPPGNAFSQYDEYIINSGNGSTYPPAYILPDLRKKLEEYYDEAVLGYNLNQNSSTTDKFSLWQYVSIPQVYGVNHGK